MPLILAALLLLAGCAGQGPPSTDAAQWRTFLFDEGRTNYNSDNLALPLKRLWTRDISAPKFYDSTPPMEFSVPAFSNGTLYAGSAAGTFYSFEAASGHVNWRSKTGRPIEAPPATAPGLVCYGDGGGSLRCLDSNTGAELWRYQARSEILSSPVITDERVYFSSTDDRVTALSISTGEKLWSYTRDTYKTVTPRVFGSPSYSEGKLYQLFSDGFLVCLSEVNGKELWSRKVVDDFSSSFKTRRTPLVYGSNVYIIDGNNAVLALGTEKGELRGRYNVIKAYDLIVKGGRTLIITGAKRVVALDRMTGSILWKTELGYAPISGLFASGDHIFILSNRKKVPWKLKFLATTRGYITALRLSDGVEVWKRGLLTTVSGYAASSEAKVALLDDEGLLEVFAGTSRSN